uniref:hypothetical protein n=1 Tax=Persephonella sp. TaxID=2060922 RepID=UPI0025CEB1CB
MAQLSYILPYLEEIFNWEDTYFFEPIKSESSARNIVKQIKNSIFLCVKNQDKIDRVFSDMGNKYSNKMIPFVNIISLISSIRNRLNEEIIKEQKFKTLIPS